MADKEGHSNSLVYQLDDIGSALNEITHAVEIRMPIITEDRFIAEIIPILQHPWSENNLTKYTRYVKELTNPLRVAGRGEGNKTAILFTVPPLYPRPGSTIAGAGAISVEQLLLYVRNEHDRGLARYDHYVGEYLKSIAGHGDIGEIVLKPIALILARYGKTFVDLMGAPLYELEPGTGGGTATKQNYASQSEDSFSSDGFLDED